MSVLIRQLNESGISFMLDGKVDMATEKQLEALHEIESSLRKTGMAADRHVPEKAEPSLIELNCFHLDELPHTRGLTSDLLLNKVFTLDVDDDLCCPRPVSSFSPEETAVASSVLLYNMALSSHRHYAVSGETVHIKKAQKSYLKALSFIRLCRPDDQDIFHLYLATLTNLACTHCEIGSVVKSEAVEDLRVTAMHACLDIHDRLDLLSILNSLLAHCSAPAPAA